MKRMISAVAGLAAAVMAQAVEVGQPAPEFEAEGTGGKVKLSDLKGKWVVLYFYPKSFTPGCTKQICSMRDGFADLEGLKAVVYGVSVDDLAKQKEFKEKHQAPFDLIADADKKLSAAFGTLAPMGLFASRRTFIISPEGKIAAVIDKPDVAAHAAQVKGEIERLQKK